MVAKSCKKLFLAAQVDRKCRFGRPCCHPRFLNFFPKMCISWYGFVRPCISSVAACSKCAGHVQDTFSHWCARVFRKVLPAIGPQSILHQQFHFLDHQNDGMRATLVTLLVTIAPLLARFAFCSPTVGYLGGSRCGKICRINASFLLTALLDRSAWQLMIDDYFITLATM